MTTLEKLQSIRARCVELLEIAEQRTPGVWAILHDEEYNGQRCVAGDTLLWWGNDYAGGRLNDADASFIAASAGPAEAGWRATIAAIDECLVAQSDMEWRGYMCRTVSSIIAAWEKTE